MDDGWYSIKRKNGDSTNHYVFNNGESTLCKKHNNVIELGDRVSKSFDENVPIYCVMCERSYGTYQHDEKRYVDLQGINTHPNVKKGFEKLNAKKIDFTDKHRQIQTQCPECKTNVCFYSDGIEKDHHCTVCNRTVTLPSGVVA